MEGAAPAPSYVSMNYVLYGPKPLLIGVLVGVLIATTDDPAVIGAVGGLSATRTQVDSSAAARCPDTGQGEARRAPVRHVLEMAEVLEAA
jgi:hypothetical protein